MRLNETQRSRLQYMYAKWPTHPISAKWPSLSLYHMIGPVTPRVTVWVQTIINRHAMFRQMCTRTDNKERCADMQFDTMKKIAEHMQSEKDARDVVPNAHTEPISTWAFLFTAQRAPKISACLISASTGGHVCQGRAKASSKRYVRW